jgi:4-amino-4-deoxy-L-arabinose transferase-like glycosyltransferase
MTRRSLLLVFLACALPRFAALAVWRVDPDTLYYRLSTGVVRDHLLAIDGGITARIEPFYPVALAAGRLFTGDHPEALLVLQIVAAAGAGVLLFLFTHAQTRDARAAWTAALLYAASPYLIRQSVAFMEVTAAIVLLVAAAWRLRSLARSRDGVVAGLLLGAIVLTRFSFLPIAIGGVLLVLRRDGPRRALVTAAAAAACILPWLGFNRVVSGAALPPRIGENLFVSTSEWARPIVPRLNVDLLLPLTDELVRDEMARRGVEQYDLARQDRLLLEWSLDYARTRPIETIAMKAKNLAYIFQPRLLPFYEMSGRATIVDGRLQIPEQPRRPLAFEIVAAGFQTLLIAGGIAGLVIRRRSWRDDAFLLIVAASVIAVNTLFFPTSRLLAPMTFVPMFYVAAAGSRLRNTGTRRLVPPSR